MLEEDGIVKRFAKGEVIFNEGDEGQEMYIVRSGKVEIFRNRDGEKVMLASLQPDDFFGEMAFFGEGTRSASARAVEDSDILIVDKDIFAGFISEPVVWSVLEKMSERIREVDDKLSNYWAKTKSS